MRSSLRSIAFAPVFLALLGAAGCKGNPAAEAKADPALEGTWTGETIGGGPALPISLSFEGAKIRQLTTVETKAGPIGFTLSGTYHAEGGKLRPTFTEAKSDYDMKSSSDKSLGFIVAGELAGIRQRMKEEGDYTYTIKDARELTMTDKTGRTVNLVRADAAPISSSTPLTK